MACRLSCLLVCALLSAAGVAQAATETYSLDPVHTRVVFLVEHAGFSHAMGSISGSSGTLRFDRDDWRSAQVDVTVPLTRLDLGDAKWNASVLGTNLLDGKHHPEAHFVSNQVEGIDADHAKVCGDLTLRGVTQPVCMDVTFNALKRHPLPPFHRTAGFSATAVLSRKAFGMTAWPTVIGDEVKVLIEAEAARGQGKGEGEGGEAPAAAEPAPAEECQPDRESETAPPASTDCQPSPQPASPQPGPDQPPPPPQ
ncbi:polyisoprenoid-binding protein YceI [Lysobacter niabensis]|uniref:Polyisoprenoid-binding protein YceI n=1 Tax=Agrilutibacter niabensis TaxID=380628 RepID=A0ABU1VKF7_9GAMM|nr:polyisoprenoid-binding protein YceI [Lysobacter niabensis]